MTTHIYCTEVTRVHYSSLGGGRNTREVEWAVVSIPARGRHAAHTAQSAAAFASHAYLDECCNDLLPGERQRYEVTVSVWIEGQNRSNSYRVEYSRGLTQSRKPQRIEL